MRSLLRSILALAVPLTACTRRGRGAALAELSANEMRLLPGSTP